MNGFQPITYGANTVVDNSEVIQKLNNIQTYSGLILNNMGISIDTGLILPEFNYNGATSQAGYGLAYGVDQIHVFRSYDYVFGIDLSAMVNNQHFLEIKFLHDGKLYTSYPKFCQFGYFYSPETYYCPISTYVGESGIFTPNFYTQEGRCTIKFVYDKTIRAPMSVLYVGKPKSIFPF